ncbi:MAG: hypothetical protein HOV79_10865 [Hamadaea sp.]|nr:hypothetical protein [Hamadaea sp.]
MVTGNRRPVVLLPSRRSGWRGRISQGLVLTLVAGLFAVLPANPALAEGAKAVAPDESTPATTVPVKPANYPEMPEWQAPSVTWPSAGSAVVALPQTSAAVSASASSAEAGSDLLSGPTASATVGGLLVTVAAVDVAADGDVLSGQILQDAADGSDLPASVSVTSIDHGVAAAADAAAGVRVARADGLTDAAVVDLRIGYGAFAHGFGGDYGGRLRPVLAPACALTTPDVPECTVRTPLVGANDAKSQTVSARVELPTAVVVGSEAQGTESGIGGLESADGTEQVAGEQIMLLAAEASSDEGTFSKTSLSSAMSWQAGMSGGGFSTSYKVNVPQVPGGLVPDITFTYSSSSVDGPNAETAQTSWLGEGWDYSPGYIERTYIGLARRTTTPRPHSRRRTRATNAGTRQTRAWCGLAGRHRWCWTARRASG